MIVISSTIGRSPAMAAPIAGADDDQLADRRVADAVRAELVQEALRDGVGAAVGADVFAHEKYLGVGQ